MHADEVVPLSNENYYIVDIKFCGNQRYGRVNPLHLLHKQLSGDVGEHQKFAPPFLTQ
ncbi:hypothetical protein NUACC26_014240 [Scytonema sp. NUACC26]